MKSVGILTEAGDQFKAIDSYLLKDYEHISDDGRFIICDICGKARYERDHSIRFMADYWAVVERPGRALVPILTGCQCQQSARHRVSEVRDGRWVETVDKTGKTNDQFTEGNHSDIIYNTKRYVYSVPQKFRDQWIEADRFWKLSPSSRYGYQMVRNLAEAVFMEGTVDQSYALYGGENAVALMCALRNAMLCYGVPAIMMDTKSILFHKSNSTPMADELDSIPVLMIILNESLAGSGEEIIKNLLSFRAFRQSKKTMFCTESKDLKAFTELVGDGIFQSVFECVGKEGNFLEIS